jgi:hypothetical protein
MLSLGSDACLTVRLILLTCLSKFRDGWEPVKAADHPELMLPGNADW